MNTILPLNRMAEILAVRVGIDTTTAENFIVRFFETIEAGLVSGETVTIKGFGTFRCEDDVVVFEPADDFAAKVNAPFEMFAPVELADGVDATTLFALMNKNAAEPVAEEPVAEKPVAEEPVAVEVTTEVENEPPADEDTPVVVAKDSIAEKPAVIESPVEKDVPVIEAELAEEDEEEAAPEDNATEEATITEPIKAVIHDYVPHRRGVSRCCVALWLIVGLIVGIIIGVFGGYLGRDKIDMLLGRVSADVSTMPNDSLSATVAEHPIDTMPVELTDSDIADINDPTTDPETDVRIESVKPATPVEVYDTITSRRFLTTMARKYYGHQDYWVYIYKANSSKLRHPDKIRPGTRVLIPDFEKYRTSPDPEQNRIDARREGVRIYEKYK